MVGAGTFHCKLTWHGEELMLWHSTWVQGLCTIAFRSNCTCQLFSRAFERCCGWSGSGSDFRPSMRWSWTSLCSSRFNRSPSRGLIPALTESFKKQLKFVLQCYRGYSHIFLTSSHLPFCHHWLCPPFKWKHNTKPNMPFLHLSRTNFIWKKIQEQGDWVIQFNKSSFAKVNFKSQQCSETDAARYHACSFF